MKKNIELLRNGKNSATAGAQKVRERWQWNGEKSREGPCDGMLAVTSAWSAYEDTSEDTCQVRWGSDGPAGLKHSVLLIGSLFSEIFLKYIDLF